MPKPVAPMQFICIGTSSADGKNVTITECKPLTSATKSATKSGVKSTVKALGDCLGPAVSQQKTDRFPLNSCQLVYPNITLVYLARAPDGGYYYVLPDGNTITFYIDASGLSISWSCTSVGVMSVGVVGSNGLNTVTPWGVYTYDGTIKADCGLLPGDPTAIVDVWSTFAVAYDPQIAILNQVTLTPQIFGGDFSVDSTCVWTPSVTVSPSTLDLACGASGSVDYTITASTSTVLVKADGYAALTLANPTAVEIIIDSVTASVTNGGTAYTFDANAPGGIAAGSDARTDVDISFPSPDSLNIQVDWLVNLSITDAAGCKSTFVKYLSVEYTASVNASCTNAALFYSLAGVVSDNLDLSGCQGTQITQSVPLGPYADSGVHIESSRGTLNAIGPGLGCPEQAFVGPNVTVNVGTCLVYCVRTQGYWTQRAAADKYDSTWDLVGGPNAPFYLSSQTWIQVLNTSATSGTYYIVAPQFIAARLNSLKAGLPLPASVQPVYDALAAAFAQYTPLQMSKLSKSAQSSLKASAKVLEYFNYGGLTGYPACL